MPRYYFHVQDGHDIPDDMGVDLPDLSAAKYHAVRYAGELILSLGAHFWEQDDWRMTVTDANGLTLFCLLFNGIESQDHGDAEAGDLKRGIGTPAS